MTGNVIHLSSLEDPAARRARKAALMMLVLREDWAALLEEAEAAVVEDDAAPRVRSTGQLDNWKGVRRVIDAEVGSS